MWSQGLLYFSLWCHVLTLESKTKSSRLIPSVNYHLQVNSAQTWSSNPDLSPASWVPPRTCPKAHLISPLGCGKRTSNLPVNLLTFSKFYMFYICIYYIKDSIRQVLDCWNPRTCTNAWHAAEVQCSVVEINGSNSNTRNQTVPPKPTPFLCSCLLNGRQKSAFGVHKAIKWEINF